MMLLLWSPIVGVNDAKANTPPVSDKVKSAQVLTAEMNLQQIASSAVNTNLCQQQALESKTVLHLQNPTFEQGVRLDLFSQSTLPLFSNCVSQDNILIGKRQYLSKLTVFNAPVLKYSLLSVGPEFAFSNALAKPKQMQLLIQPQPLWLPIVNDHEFDFVSNKELALNQSRILTQTPLFNILRC